MIILENRDDYSNKFRNYLPYVIGMYLFTRKRYLYEGEVKNDVINGTDNFNLRMSQNMKGIWNGDIQGLASINLLIQ